jgi:hypothetical protein
MTPPVVPTEAERSEAQWRDLVSVRQGPSTSLRSARGDGVL